MLSNTGQTCKPNLLIELYFQYESSFTTFYVLTHFLLKRLSDFSLICLHNFPAIWIYIRQSPDINLPQWRLAEQKACDRSGAKYKSHSCTCHFELRVAYIIFAKKKWNESVQQCFIDIFILSCLVVIWVHGIACCEIWIKIAIFSVNPHCNQFLRMLHLM